MHRRVLALAVAVALGSVAGCDSGGPGSPTLSPVPSEVPAPSDDAVTAASDPPGNGAAAPFRLFATGGPAAAFDDQVDVSVAGTVVLTLDRARARDRQSWVVGTRSLLEPAAHARLRPPRSCRGLPSPVGPPLEHEVDVSGMAVLWRPRACDFTVRLLLDRENEIAAVAVDVGR